VHALILEANGCRLSLVLGQVPEPTLESATSMVNILRAHAREQHIVKQVGAHDVDGKPRYLLCGQSSLGVRPFACVNGRLGRRLGKEQSSGSLEGKMSRSALTLLDRIVVASHRVYVLLQAVKVVSAHVKDSDKGVAIAEELPMEDLINALQVGPSTRYRNKPLSCF
jgi:hypothetical protein